MEASSLVTAPPAPLLQNAVSATSSGSPLSIAATRKRRDSLTALVAGGS